jgi:hypothetical protein
MFYESLHVSIFRSRFFLAMAIPNAGKHKVSSSSHQAGMIAGGDAGIEKLDIAIVGGGPSGVSVALALLREVPQATSNIALFESDSFQHKGASIVFSRAGWDALRCIDPDACRKAQRNGAPVAALFFKDFSGNHKLTDDTTCVMHFGTGWWRLAYLSESASLVIACDDRVPR